MLFCSDAQSMITLSNNTHNTHVTLDPWDIPTARDQNELTRLFAAPSAYSIVSYDDDFFAVKPAMMAILFNCVRATMPNTGPFSNPNSGSRNDDVDDDDGQASQTGALSQTDDDEFDDDDEQASQTGSLSRTC